MNDADAAAAMLLLIESEGFVTEVMPRIECHWCECRIEVGDYVVREADLPGIVFAHAYVENCRKAVQRFNRKLMTGAPKLDVPDSVSLYEKGRRGPRQRIGKPVKAPPK